MLKKSKSTLTHWKDKRDVLCEMEDYTTRRRDVQRRSLISEYNKNMGHLDQYLVYYALGRKSTRGFSGNH